MAATSRSTNLESEADSDREPCAPAAGDVASPYSLKAPSGVSSLNLPVEHLSLLDPPGSFKELSGDTKRDVGLSAIAEWFSHPASPPSETLRILSRLPQDSETIRYRQAIFQDLAANPNLRGAIESLIPKMQELTVFSRSSGESEAPFLAAVWRLGELDLYVEIVGELGTHLGVGDSASWQPASDGLRALAEEVARTMADPAFQELKETLPELRKGIKAKRSVTIGVNLDERLRPVEAALLSINDKPYEEGGLLSRFFDARSGKMRSAGRMHRTPTAVDIGLPLEQKVPLAPLFADIETLMRSIARPLLHGVKRYLSVQTGALKSLYPELAFYLGAHRAMEELSAAGYPVCIPKVAPETGSVFRAEGFYNLHLARSSTPKAVVRNPVALERPAGDEAQAGNRQSVENETAAAGQPQATDNGAQIFVLTGPNQGGKTTYVQGIGIAQLLFQAGLFVPAERATITPCDTLETHFPSAEKGALDTGRLDAELSRLSEMIRRVTSRSLVLLNETLSSTSPTEGAYLAGELLKGLLHRGARCVFATHLHEVAENVDRINSAVSAPGRIANLRAGVRVRKEGATRTFEIAPGPPPGISYAEDLARRHGLSFEDIRGGE